MSLQLPQTKGTQCPLFVGSFVGSFIHFIARLLIHVFIGS